MIKLHSIATAAVVPQLAAHLATSSIMVTTARNPPPFFILERLLLDGKALGIASSTCLLFSLPTIGRSPTITTSAVEGTEIPACVNSTDGLIGAATITIGRFGTLCDLNAVKATPCEGCKSIATEEG